MLIAHKNHHKKYDCVVVVKRNQHLIIYLQFTLKQHKQKVIYSKNFTKKKDFLVYGSFIKEGITLGFISNKRNITQFRKKRLSHLVIFRIRALTFCTVTSIGCIF